VIADAGCAVRGRRGGMEENTEGNVVESEVATAGNGKPRHCGSECVIVGKVVIDGVIAARCFFFFVSSLIACDLSRSWQYTHSYARAPATTDPP